MKLDENLLSKWQNALRGLGFSDAQIEQQMADLAELASLKFSQSVVQDNPGATEGDMPKLIQTTPPEKLAELTANAMNATTAQFLDHIEKRFSVEKRLAFEQALQA